MTTQYTGPEDPAETARWEAEKQADRLADELRKGPLQVVPQSQFDGYQSPALVYIGANHLGTYTCQLDGDLLDVSQMPRRERALATALLRLALERLEAAP